MKTTILITGVCIAIGSALCAQTPAPRPASPKVVDSSPKPWDTRVSPTSQKEVTITFDQPMVPAFTAWLGESGLPPDLDLDTSRTTADRKTFHIKAGLEPGKTYVVAMNETGIPGAGFQNDRGLSAPPYFLVFQTLGNIPPADAPPRAISTIPPHNAQQLDPNKVKSVTVTFDKPMKTGKHGLQMTENGKPVDLSKARFQYSPDGKTFTLGYEFKQSSTYEFELNNTQDIGFASAKRIPLWPVKFTFSTGQPQ